MVANIRPGEALRLVLGIDQLRVRIQGELASLQLEIEAAPQHDLLVQLIAVWKNNFSESLRHPNQQEVIKAYVPELVKLLRSPFGDHSIPLIRMIEQKVRDPDSLFYDEAFAVPSAALLNQLRQIEAMMKGQLQREAAAVNEVQNHLEGHAREREAKILERIDELARRHIEERQRIGNGIQRLGAQDQELRAKILEDANRLKRKADELNAGANRLQEELNVNRGKLGELERANKQLQIDIERTRAQIEDKKSSWLTQALCIGGSIALSYICQRPIVIYPPS